MSISEGSDPINPTTMDMMSDEDILKILDDMRSRRLVLVIEYQRVQRIKNAAKHETIVSKAQKLGDKIAKQVEKVDELISKVETYRHQIQALRIQALSVYDEELPE